MMPGVHSGHSCFQRPSREPRQHSNGSAMLHTCFEAALRLDFPTSTLCDLDGSIRLTGFRWGDHRIQNLGQPGPVAPRHPCRASMPGSCFHVSGSGSSCQDHPSASATSACAGHPLPFRDNKNALEKKQAPGMRGRLWPVESLKNGAARGNRTHDLSLTNKPDYLVILLFFNYFC